MASSGGVARLFELVHHSGKRVCTARATAPLQTFVLTRESYLRLRADCPGLALMLQEGILRTLAGVIQQLDEVRSSAS